MSSKAMQLIDPSSGLMECRYCGSTHFASLRNGRYRRGSWQCLNGCRAPTFVRVRVEEVRQEQRTMHIAVEKSDPTPIRIAVRRL